MHGKLILSPRDNFSFSGANVLFFNQINLLLFCGIRGVVYSYAESSKIAPIFSFTLCTIKHFLAITVSLSACTNKGGARLFVCTQLK